MEEEQVKKQFILNEEKELTEIPKSLCAAVKYPIKCKLKNAFEVFAKIKQHSMNTNKVNVIIVFLRWRKV